MNPVVNVFKADNLEGRIDVARALGASAMAMYVDDEYIFVRDTVVPWSHGEDGWGKAD
jgi:hypothetical protein